MTPLEIGLDLFGNCLASRDDANDPAITPIAVTNEQQSKGAAQTKKNKAIFVVRMIGVVDQLGALINEDGLGLLEAHLVLPQIRGGFSIIPFESKSAHSRSVTTM